MQHPAADGRRKIRPAHLDRAAYIYVRQSSPFQVQNNHESRMRQYARAEWAVQAGWSAERVMVVDEDQGETATSPGARAGFARLVSAATRSGWS